jgi:23S rRNA pseudouridine1911/1915/1917 synthase
MLLDIIFENEDFVILNKPAKILVHPSNTNKKEISLIDELLKRYPFIKDVGENTLRPGIVHRLDRDTSGLLIIVKKQVAFIKFKELFKKRKIKKIYKALVFGRIKQDKGSFKTYIARSNKDPRKRITLPRPKNSVKTKEAKTYYKVVQRYKDIKEYDYTLLEVQIKTGRTHQIRSQFFSINYPLVGDPIYKIKSKQETNLTRTFLHAEKLAFKFKNRYYEFYSPLPQDLKNFLSKLRKCQKI